jgi:hypothetical protein
MRSLWGKFLDWLFKAGSFWRNAALLFVAYLTIPAFIAAFEERRPVAAFAETFFAAAIYHIAVFGSVGAGIAAGLFAAKKHIALGWIVGIFVFFVFGLGVRFGADKIPGVGWRIEKLYQDSSE